ncbi:conserved hypothetical protein [Altererythrobacter sp. B11]|uniref:hypothetical protein n=1 Tax=Altererythrobacter sp. B11 TaxID=2060312 RepID=UPI000DC6DA41|nr:hypothetical protein [Altererythrobacter sp. B11]BBC71058.1 conserved hypothetical protein [Altererythrobacter sp. B11]
MRTLSLCAAAGGAALMLSACDVEQTKEGEAPEVSVDAGELPEYDVDAPDVNVRTEEKTVEVPVVDVDEPDAGVKGTDEQ